MTNDAAANVGRPATTRPPVAEAAGVSKSFGSTLALRDVSLDVHAAECHALVGRNGAGKSTLVSILTGLTRPDRGHVRLLGEPAPTSGDRAAWQERVACVYQKSMVIPTLTVAENVFLNRATAKETQLVNWRGMRARARQLMLEWGFDLDVRLLAADLSVEQRQTVEIVRALSIGARFLILDEPTAALESHAIERLFAHIRRLKASGVGILYISHHLEEIYDICDRATVLRDGRRIVTAPVAELEHDQLVTAMLGTALERTVGRPVDEAARGSAPRLTVSGLSANSPLGAVEDISFEVAAGECLGLVGLRGSGTATVADAIAGLVKPTAGKILVDRRPLPPGKADRALERGIGYVPEDRHARGYVPELGVAENVTLPVLERLSRFGIVSSSRRAAVADELARRVQIVSHGSDQPVAELSGGNQQKVVVGRALVSDPSLLVAVGPTVGVDVASKEALLSLIDRARSEGIGVLLVSDDLDELRVCTRLLVFVRGRIVREFRTRPWDRHELIAAAEGLERVA